MIKKVKIIQKQNISKKAIINVLHFPRWFIIISELGIYKEEKIYITQMKKIIDEKYNTNITFSYIIKIIKELKERDILSVSKEGRIKIISLTPKGKIMTTNINILLNIIQDVKSK